MATVATAVQMPLGPVCFSDPSYVVYYVGKGVRDREKRGLGIEPA